MSNEITNPNRVLTKEGLSWLWGKIKTALGAKADKSELNNYAALDSSPEFTDTNVIIKDSSLDMTKANNNVSTDTYHNYLFRDINNVGYAMFEGGTLANGKTLVGMYVQNYLTSGSTYSNFRGLQATLDKSNNITWSVADPSAFRTAISAKGTQTAKSDPTASGTSATFIDSISQDAQGVITATKKTVRTFTKSGSSAATGLVPAPSTTAGTTKFLCEDATWKTALTSHQDISNKKNTQTAVSSPSSSGSTISFIDTISQNTQGVITATKKAVRDASTSQSGVVTTGTQSFAGTKIFTGNVVAKNSATSPYYMFRGTDLDTSNAGIYALSAETSDGKYGAPQMTFYQYSPASGGASRTDYYDRYYFPAVSSGKTGNNSYTILAAFKNAPSFTSFSISNGSNKTFTISNSYRGMFYLIGTSAGAQEQVMVYSTSAGAIAYTEYTPGNTASLSSPFTFTKGTNSFKIANNSGYTVYVHIMTFTGSTPT